VTVPAFARRQLESALAVEIAMWRPTTGAPSADRYVPTTAGETTVECTIGSTQPVSISVAMAAMTRRRAANGFAESEDTQMCV
jgi:hypothetical protein